MWCQPALIKIYNKGLYTEQNLGYNTYIGIRR